MLIYVLYAHMYEKIIHMRIRYACFSNICAYFTIKMRNVSYKKGWLSKFYVSFAKEKIFVKKQAQNALAFYDFHYFSFLRCWHVSQSAAEQPMHFPCFFLRTI